LPELKFKDFYKMPVGPKGLEPSERLLRLRNQRVRILGYMVQAEEPVPGIFLLAPVPVSIPEKEDGPSDDLPGATLFVHMHHRMRTRCWRFAPVFGNWRENWN
jgi:hypothetical protein